MSFISIQVFIYMYDGFIHFHAVLVHLLVYESGPSTMLIKKNHTKGHNWVTGFELTHVK